MRWFDASSRRATPKGQTFITCTALHQEVTPYTLTPLRARGALKIAKDPVLPPLHTTASGTPPLHAPPPPRPGRTKDQKSPPLFPAEKHPPFSHAPHHLDPRYRHNAFKWR